MEKNEKGHIARMIEEYGAKLFGFIRKRVSNEEDAEDILQEVWYQFSVALNAEPIEHASAWLHRVAGNKIIDRYRKYKPVSYDELAYEDDEGEISFRDLLLNDDNTPETKYISGLFWEQLNNALDELPDEQRQVFIWNELEDLSFQQIAEKTGENMNTLLSRKRYAVLHLRKRLKELYDEIIEH